MAGGVSAIKVVSLKMPDDLWECWEEGGTRERKTNTYHADKRDFWKKKLSPEASTSVVRAGGRLHLDVMSQGRVAGLASCPLQKGCGPADRRARLSRPTIPWRFGSSS